MSQSPSQSPTGTDRRTFWTRSPSPLGHRTPKRRTRDESLPLPKVQRKLEISDDVKVSFAEFQECVKKNGAIIATENEDLLVAKSIAKFGLKTLVCAINACYHVPENFLNRDTYIYNIVTQIHPNISSNIVDELISIVPHMKTDISSVTSSAFRNVLWKASFKHQEPYLNFLTPNISDCLNGDCDGKLYPCYKSTATIYKLTGPEPAMKCSLRCRSCSSRYHINCYTVPNEGKKYYPDNFHT